MFSSKKAAPPAASAAKAPETPAAPVAPGSNPVGSAGLSAVIGYASAVLFKTVASSALIIFASELALLKWMELQGFLTINWAALHAWLGAKAQLLDQNGDGKLDAKDAHVLASRFSTFMSATAPSAAGFVAGFSYGMM